VLPTPDGDGSKHIRSASPKLAGMSQQLPEDVAVRLREDPRMAGLIDSHGPMTVEPATNEFQRVVVSIINQSISTAAARAMREDLFSAFEEPITPRDLLDAGEQHLAAVVGAQKAEYILNVARAYDDGALSAEQFAGASEDEVIGALTGIRGVGRWTADMYLLFVLGREDVFPIGDLGVRRGIEEVYGDMSREEMVEKSRDWQPFRSYATKYLWAAYES